MEDERHREAIDRLNSLLKDAASGSLAIFLFGHSNATETIVDEILESGYRPVAILDNSPEKTGKNYREVPIVLPEAILKTSNERAVVLIASRFYEDMVSQLRKIGYSGAVLKLTDYNTFSEYSTSDEVIKRKTERAGRGVKILENLESEYPGFYRVFCPFQALGDVYFTMMYLAEFIKRKKKEKCLVLTVGNSCKEVSDLFPGFMTLSLSQREMDEAVQGVIYLNDKNSFIAHQDRPYVVKLHRALYLKCIPLQIIYCAGVFGLPVDTNPSVPSKWDIYHTLEDIPRNRSVILSPYAKSVTTFTEVFWKEIVEDFKDQGFMVFTNVSSNESPLPKTLPISPKISELKSVVERAGTFIGIRSGICDVIRSCDCKKIALYPDYYYSDTKWKAVDIYSIDGFVNIDVKEGMSWTEIKEKNL